MPSGVVDFHFYSNWIFLFSEGGVKSWCICICDSLDNCTPCSCSLAGLPFMDIFRNEGFFFHLSKLWLSRFSKTSCPTQKLKTITLPPCGERKSFFSLPFYSIHEKYAKHVPNEFFNNYKIKSNHFLTCCSGAGWCLSISGALSCQQAPGVVSMQVRP